MAPNVKKVHSGYIVEKNIKRAMFAGQRWNEDGETLSEMQFLHSMTAECVSDKGKQWRMASGTWFGETPRHSQAKSVTQQHARISPNHVPEAMSHCVVVIFKAQMLGK